jgi:ABC-type dipeptide/oligopeptide/nickel transport system permease subunit
VIVGLVVVVAWCALALLAPVIAPYQPLQQNIQQRLQPPNDTYRLGTDELGRDVLSRVLYGGRITIPAGLAVVVINAIVGWLVGAVAGYVGRVWDEVMMRVTELFMAFPTIILAMAVTAALGPEIRNAVLALAIVRWTNYARLTRGLVIEAKTAEYVRPPAASEPGTATCCSRRCSRTPSRPSWSTARSTSATRSCSSPA